MGRAPAQPAQDFAGGGEIVAVNAAQQFGPQHRHVLGIAGADEKVALVGTGAAAHADVHEHLEGPELLQPFPEPLENDLLPVFRQLPVVLQRVPGAGIGKAQGFDAFGVGCIAIHPLADIHRRVHPTGAGRTMTYL
jgi:hypothetical protein